MTLNSPLDVVPSISPGSEVKASPELKPVPASIESKFLFHLHEAFSHKTRFGISRDNLRKMGYTKLAQMPVSGDLLYFDFRQSSSTAYYLKKRAIDLTVSTLAILLLLPMSVCISICVLVDIGWPVFFLQHRLNHNGKKILFIKFRSMKKGSDKDLHRMKAMQSFINGGDSTQPCKKIVNESLISKSGRILRKYSLDELPQIFCVLLGTMSMVGPRPCLQQEYESYKEWHKLRLLAKPGCTGMWQVYGRSIVSFDESVLMDIYYSTQKNPFLDLKLIYKTIPVMILGKGGY